MLKCNDCLFEQNFAIEGGVVNVDLDGAYEIYDSLIVNNSAYSNPISKIMISALDSIVSSSVIYDNF